MNANIQIWKQKSIDFWNSFPPKKRWMLVGTFFATLILLVVLTRWVTQPNFVSIYTNLRPNEAGEIKAAIEAMGIPVQLSSDGKTILVPSKEAASLKVTLAAEGIPKSGNVDYEIFSENIGLGMTDRHFDVVERDAMQSEIAYLIEQIIGINEANVMITLPKESIWLNETNQIATASVVLSLAPGYKLDQAQINGLYHLISKSVPNLPENEVVIMDQYGQVFDLVKTENLQTTLTQYQQQQAIQSEIEKDIQRKIQQMLGTILGQDKIIVSVVASVDFTRERREESLVRPIDTDNNEGLTVSIERIVESFSGTGNAPNDPVGLGEDDTIETYQGAEPSGNSEFEKKEERINQEFDRINRQIELSPYVIDDITINVGVEPPIPNEPASLTPQHIQDIKNILTNVVRATLSASNQALDDQVLEKKISVFASEFKGKQEIIANGNNAATRLIPVVVWYVLAGIIVVGILGFMLFRKKRMANQPAEISYEELVYPREVAATKPVLDSFAELEKEKEPSMQQLRKEIETLVAQNPNDFVNTLRIWLKED